MSTVWYPAIKYVQYVMEALTAKLQPRPDVGIPHLITYADLLFLTGKFYLAV